MQDNSHYRFLIIDDTTDYVEALKKILELKFPECEVFDSRGDDIIEKAIKHNVDLIFLDVKDPNNQPVGLATFRQALSGNDKTRDIPVIFISSEQTPDIYQPWLKRILENNPNDDFIHKSLIGQSPDYFWFRVLHNLTQHSKAIPPRIDVAIVCALESELESVVETFDLKEENDPWIGYSGEIRTKSGKVIKIIAAESGMGMPKATCIGMSLCLKYKPKILAMTGIAAVVAEGMKIGDIMLPTECWHYDNGKITEAGEESIVKFEARISQLPTNENVKKLCKKIYNDFKSELSDPISKFLNEKNRTAGFHPGPFASGSSVIASEKYISDNIKGQHSKIIGFDMEAYGIYQVAKLMEKESHFPPVPIVLKSVSDMGGNKGNLKPLETINQKCATFTSAIFLRRLLENYDF